MMNISAVIITENEEDWLENCLKSISGLVDEIIVVDSGSIDKTLEIAKKYKAQVFNHEWEGFSRQKNFALQKARGPWIFFIDADERVSRALYQEIKTITDSSVSKSQNTIPQQANSYAIPRQNFLLGQPVKHGGWWPDYVIRLALRDRIVGWEGNLHETLKIKGDLKKLKNPMYHLSHRGIAWMLAKSAIYTPIEAKLRFETNHPKVTWWRFLRVMISEFWYRLILKSGWKDGTVGWIEAISQAFNMFLIYVNLWEMQKGKSMEEIYKEIDKKITEEIQEK